MRKTAEKEHCASPPEALDPAVKIFASVKAQS